MISKPYKFCLLLLTTQMPLPGYFFYVALYPLKISTIKNIVFASFAICLQEIYSCNFIKPNKSLEGDGGECSRAETPSKQRISSAGNSFIDNSKSLLIKGGRHPVIERQLNAGESYVPNNTQLDRNNQQIIMITGPNMSGKSALLRQTALIVLMAQIGCFVPAEAAQIGIIDKIFTRVGASDNISMGESTFMVEMNETASILNNISERSLILLDEIGRGTSTYDGVSIAWAIAEFLHEHQSKAKTLFATHYHELNEMTNSFERIKNYNVSVKEIDGKIIFLRKLKKGGSAHSFGIHVAQMAGMPSSIVKRANIIMQQLESSLSANELKEKSKHISKKGNRK